MKVTDQVSDTPADRMRAIAAEIYSAWEHDNDSRVGKMLRALADPAFASQYRADIADLHASLKATHPARGVVGELARIGELIRTQDNRITDAPIFIVQQKRKICGIDADYTNTFEWLDPRDTSEVYDDAAKAERDAARAEEGLQPIEWQQGGYIEIWEFVTACFTEQGCKDYLARDGHNLREPRIYAAGSYRNHEWRTVRDALKAGQPAVPSVPEGCRFFASGPETSFFVAKAHSAEYLIDAAGFDRDEWTVTDLAATPKDQPAQGVG